MTTKELEEMDGLPIDVLCQMSAMGLVPYITYLRGRLLQMQEDMRNGFKYATTGELAKELGATEEDAVATETRLEYLTTGGLKVVRPNRY